MSDATTAAPAASPAASPAAAPASAPAAPAPGGDTLMASDSAAAPAAAPAAPAAVPAADAKDGKPGEESKDGKDGKPAAGAPEKYEDFKLPEGVKVMDDTRMGKFTEWAKANNLTQEAAQQAMDMATDMLKGNSEQLNAAIERQAKAWGEAAQTDKEFGGDKFTENLAVAKKALDQFGSPELKSLLAQSKFGNHPEVIRFFYRAGKAISEDGFVPGRAGSNGERKSHQEVLYGNTTH